MSRLTNWFLGIRTEERRARRMTGAVVCAGCGHRRELTADELAQFLAAQTFPPAHCERGWQLIVTSRPSLE